MIQPPRNSEADLQKRALTNAELYHILATHVT